MESIAISRLHWKELRTQGVIWLALFAMCFMFAIAVIVLVDPYNLAVVMDSLIFVAPALFALACGSFAFASEDETGTISILRRLPINSRDLLRAKVGFGLIGLLLFYILFAAVVWIAAFQLRPRLLSAPGHFHYAFWGLEALFWSAFFSMRTRSSFASAAWAAVIVASITIVFEILLSKSYPVQIAAVLARILSLGFVTARLIPQSDEWFHDFEVQSKPNALNWLIERLIRIPRDIGRVLWLSWRENRAIIWICLAAIGISLTSAVYFLVVSRFEHVESLATSYRWQNYQRTLTQYPLPPYFWLMIAASLFNGLLSGSLGLITFGTPRQLRGVPMLAHQGISPRLVAAVRIALYVGLASIVWLTAGIAIVIGLLYRQDPYDGGLVLQFAFMLPAWCCVASLWSSFHTTKKVVAYIAGIILATFACAIQFVFANASISLSIGKYSIFFGLCLFLVVYTIVFATAWSLQRWSRVRRMASWSLFPLALVGLYVGTGIYRMNDVPNPSLINTFIPEPKNVPDVKIVKSPSKILPNDVFGEQLSDYDMSKLNWYNVGRGQANLDWFSEWLVTDPTSLHWLGRNLESTQTTYRFFKEVEPTIQWIRDQLNSMDCVVVGWSDNLQEEQHGYNWLLFGAVAKLKESNPAESLAYARSLIRLATNQRFLNAQKKLWGDDATRRNANFIEIQALEFLDVWANHESTKINPALLEDAIGLIPEPNAGLDLDIFTIARSYHRLKTNLESDDPPFLDRGDWYGNSMPIDRRVLSIVRALVPWERERNLKLLDYAVGLAYQWRTNPTALTRYAVNGRKERYSKYLSSLRPSNFDKLVEARVSAKEKLEKALASVQEAKE